jgi:hypothetical protein
MKKQKPKQAPAASKVYHSAADLKHIQPPYDSGMRQKPCQP